MIFGTFVKVILGFYMGCVGVVKTPPVSPNMTYRGVTLTCKYQDSSTFVTIDRGIHDYKIKKISSKEYDAFFKQGD